MTKRVSSLLKEYFEQPEYDLISITNGLVNRNLEKKTCTPIQPKTFSWEVHDSPERFSKTFNFQERERLIDFVGEVLAYEDEANHHGTIKISFNEVIVEVYTHDVNRITELDKEYVNTIDQIYGDVLNFAY